MQAERRNAQAVVTASTKAERLTKNQIENLVKQLGGIMQTLADSTPEDRTEVYRQFQVRLTYQPDRHVVHAAANTAGSCAQDRVRGGT